MFNRVSSSNLVPYIARVFFSNMSILIEYRL